MIEIQSNLPPPLHELTSHVIGFLLRECTVHGVPLRFSTLPYTQCSTCTVRFGFRASENGTFP